MGSPLLAIPQIEANIQLQRQQPLPSAQRQLHREGSTSTAALALTIAPALHSSTAVPKAMVTSTATHPQQNVQRWQGRAIGQRPHAPGQQLDDAQTTQISHVNEAVHHPNNQDDRRVANGLQHKASHHNHERSSSSTGGAGTPSHNSLQMSEPLPAIPSTPALHVASAGQPPLFERIVSEDGAAELKSFARVIESQNRKLAELERTHQELERRLESESKKRVDLEERLEDQSQSWTERCRKMEEERDSWKKVVSTERLKNEKLLEQVNRKNMEIHRFIQRKYDSAPHYTSSPGPQHHHRQGSSAASTSAKGSPSSPHCGPSSRSGTTHNHNMSLKSPHELLVASGSGETVRERNVTNTLLDFFGM